MICCCTRDWICGGSKTLISGGSTISVTVAGSLKYDSLAKSNIIHHRLRVLLVNQSEKGMKRIYCSDHVFGQAGLANSAYPDQTAPKGAV